MENCAVSKSHIRKSGFNEDVINKYYTLLENLRKRIHPDQPLAPFPKEFYLSCSDDAKIFVQMFIPPEPSAIVLFQHGNTIQSDLCYPLADYLYPRKIGVIAVDNRGHGRSGPRQGLFNKPSLIFPIYQFLFSLFPKIPHHIMGESIGCTMVTDFLLSDYAKSTKIDSVIMQVPPYQLRGIPFFPKLKWVLKILTELISALSLEKNIFFNKPQIQPGYYPEFTAIDFFDPIKVGVITSRHLSTAASLVTNFQSKVKGISHPALILEGTADSICEPKGAVSLFHQIKNPKKKVRFFKGAEHSLFNDKHSIDVFPEIYEWILKFNQKNIIN